MILTENNIFKRIIRKIYIKTCRLWNKIVYCKPRYESDRIMH